MNSNNKFNFFVPLEFEKGKKTDEEGLPEELIISGIASTADRDSDGEILEPNGYDLQRFLSAGFLNLEHQARNDMGNIVGEPIEAKIKDNKLHIKGKLYKSNEKAKNIYKTALILEKEKSKRKIGFSIEGKAIKRDPFDPKKILKAAITHCAITATPKNQSTFLEIVKGEGGEQYIDSQEEANGGTTYIVDIVRPDGTRLTIDKDFNIKVEKAMSAGSQTGTELTGKVTSGASLKKESLRDKLSNLQKSVIMNIAEGFRSKKIKDEERAKKIVQSFFV